MATEFGLLGDVEARTGDHPIDLGHTRQRCVLAVLLVEANRIVRVDHLLERVWGEQRPQRPHASLYSYLSRLRNCLAGADDVSLARRSGGYLLTVDPAAVDLHRFHTLIELARATGDDGQALQIFDEALGLWRGTPLAHLDTPWVNDVRVALEHDRVAAERDRTDVALRRGQHAALLPQLARSTQEHPLDERLAGQLMLALCRTGRQADALSHYERLRRRLAASLGVDPSPDLQRLHLQVLTGDPAVTGAFAGQPPAADPPPPAGTPPAPAQVPRQLPAPPPLFTGRTGELSQLTELADRAGSGEGRAAEVVVSVIGGTGGVGKTWLALRWAHDHLERYPDGQLYVNLRGFDAGEPMPATAALRGFLDALHVPPSSIPTDLDGRAGLYRSVVAGKRLVIVLDDAHDTAQVVPLLPGSPSCAVLVTSRLRLGGLVTAHGARWIDLDVLSDLESRQLLAQRLDHHRMVGEPGSVDEIVRRCGGLPLALSIVAARAAMQPGLPLSVVIEELREEATRLDAFSAGDISADLRTVFAASYHALSANTARLFLLLGLAPAAEIGLPAVTGLIGLPEARTRLLLKELEDTHLVQRQRRDRYRMHDLVRLYAADRARHDQPPPVRHAAVHRLLDHYLHTAHRAALLIDPQREPIALAAAPPGITVEPLANHPDALDWFTREHPALLGAVRDAAERGLDDYVWRLAWTLETFLDYQGHWTDRVSTQRLALDAARRLGDRSRQAHSHRSLGVAFTQLGSLDEGYAQHGVALAIFTELGDLAKQADAHRGLGWVRHQQREWRQALEHNERALRLYRRLDHRAGQAMALNNAGWLHAMLGEYRQALALCGQAVAFNQEIGDGHAEAGAWDSLGYAHHHLREYTEAADCYERALDLVRRFDDRFNEVEILRHLAETRRATGDLDAARQALRAAETALEHLGHPDAGAVRSQLRQL